MKLNIVIFTALIALALGVAFGQVTTGTISGTVTDSSGAVLPGAKIVILNEGNGVTRDAAADSAGHYSAPSLLPGHYRVTATAEGFQGEIRTGIDLTVGAQAIIDLKLNVGAVSQSVEVAGEAPLVQTTESTVSYLVGDTSIRELPLNGRDMTRLILLNPGVSYSVNSPANQSYNGFGKRLSISGSRGEDNIYLMDGSLIADFKRHIPAGPSGSLMGVETVQEFQVLTNSLQAQYGRVLGGVFNAVSKSGTNEWHGDLFEFLRNSDLDARNFFDRGQGNGVPRLPPFRRNQFGGTVGGPVKKDKAFFFVAYEGTRQSLTTTKTTTVPTANARSGIGILPNGQVVNVSPKVVPYLVLFPLPSPGGRDFGNGTAQYIFPAGQPTHDNFGQARFDYQYSEKDSIFVRFTGSNSNQTNVVSYPGFVQDSSLGSELMTISETHVFNPTTLATTRLHVNRVVPLDIGIYPPFPQNLLSAPNQPFPPEFNVGSGVTTEAGFDTTPTYFVSNRFTVQHDINKTIGKHSFQFGGFAERLQLNGEFNDRGMGVWTFADLPSFLQGIVSTYRGSPPGFGTFIRGMRQNFFALYVQDNWRLSSKLTLNLGVRWEPYSVPTEVNGLIANLRHINDTVGTVGGPYWLNKSWKDIGPRIGLAWSPFADGKTSIRAGVGLLFEPNDPNQYYTQMVRQPPLAYDFTIPTTGHFPDAFAEIAASPTKGPGYAIPYDNNKSPRTLQYNINVQQQIGANAVVSVGYNGSRGINLLTVGNYNMSRPVWDGLSTALPTTATLVNPNWSQIVIYANNANSWYSGLIVSAQRKFAGGFQGQIAYTFSKALSQADSGQTAGGVATGGGYLKNPTDMSSMKGLSGYDFRNIFSANYSYDIPFFKGSHSLVSKVLGGWQLTGIITAQSGQPESVLGTVPAALSALGAQIVTPNMAPGFNIGNIHSGTTAGCTGVAAGRKLGTPDLYFDPCAFTAPGARELGNVGRNTLIGPGLVTWDPGLYKDFKATERLRMEFRAEFFNILNRANFAAPASTVFTATSAVTGLASRVGNAGVITTTVTTSRQVQLALKLIF